MIANTHLIHNSLQQTQSFKEFPNAGTGICITKQQHAFEGIKHLCRNKGKLPNGPHHQTFLEVLLPTLDAMKVNHSAPPAHMYKIDCNHRTADFPDCLPLLAIRIHSDQTEACMPTSRSRIQFPYQSSNFRALSWQKHFILRKWERSNPNTCYNSICQTVYTRFPEYNLRCSSSVSRSSLAESLFAECCLFEAAPSVLTIKINYNFM